MPGYGNGHAHYMPGYALSTVGTMVNMDDTPQKFMTEILPATVKKARANGSTTVFGQGWNTMDFLKNMPTRQQLDAICSDIPMYIADEEGLLTVNDNLQ